MEYDLIALFDHPVSLFEFIPAAIVTFGAGGTNRCEIDVVWRRAAGDQEFEGRLALRWDLDAIRVNTPQIDRQLRSRLEHDDDQATRTEEAAVVVAVAVMANVEPRMRITRRSMTWTRHDYYLNGSRDEMIEVAGRWEGGLPGLFDEKRAQSDLNPKLRKRWVSVTIMRQQPRNRTEGRHT